ncbi:YIP1 family protein [Calditrichota bacterium]
MEEQNNTSPPEPTQDFGIIAKMAGIILAPQKTIPKILKAKDFWVPILIVGIALSVFRLLMLPNIYEYYDSGELRELIMEVKKVEAEQAEQDAAQLKNIIPGLLVLEALIMVTLGTFMVALLLRLIGIIGLKQWYPMQTLMTMTAWVSLVSVIPIILSLPVKIFLPDFVLPTSLGLILPEDITGQFFHSFLLALDIFLIWQVWLLSVGMTKLYNISMQRAVNITGTLFLAFALVNAMMSGQQ